jgi:hypothetical protein
MTRSVAAHSRRADAVLVAVGKPKFLHGDMVKPGAAVIDIGINQVAGPNGETMIVGDVDTDDVKKIASWVTPVPGGVGPVTVAMFMRNAITAHEAARCRLARLTTVRCDGSVIGMVAIVWKSLRALQSAPCRVARARWSWSKDQTAGGRSAVRFANVQRTRLP